VVGPPCSRIGSAAPSAPVRDPAADGHRKYAADVAKKDEKLTVEVAGRTLAVSNLEKVLFPATGFTKGEVIDYYVTVADAILPLLADRPLTRKRWPNGTSSPPFFEKNAPGGTPDFVRVVHIDSQGDGVDYPVVHDLPTLVWLANLAALELHAPQWRVDEDDTPRPPDLMVFDLDPGPSMDIIDCCNVALAIRAALEVDGLIAYPKTSGNKGAQLYVPIMTESREAPSTYARRLAQELAGALPELVVATMDKQVRRGRVFIDWSQNNVNKTTIAAYSLRGREAPSVSTPLSWDEVADASSAGDLTFTPADVMARLEEVGDLLAELFDDPQPLPDQSA
jgi:bifunctional non-homologous end joining protein LigD